jgi:hypothetical protein
VTRFNFGTALAGTGIALISAGAAVAALADGGIFGFVLILLGGFGFLVGFALLVIGFRAHFAAASAREAAASAREAVRDAHLERQDAREEERIVMDRHTFQSAAARDAIIQAETSEAKDAATATAIQALAAELAAAHRALAQQAIRRRIIDEDDERAQHLSDLALQAGHIRVDAIERQLSLLKSELPNKTQRQREAIEALNNMVRRL